MFCAVLSFQFHMRRFHLGPYYQLCGQKRMRLILSRVGAVYNVGHKLRSEGKFEVVAIDEPGLVFVDDEQVVTSL
jgi:hypothetical protein